MTNVVHIHQKKTEQTEKLVEMVLATRDLWEETKRIRAEIAFMESYWDSGLSEAKCSGDLAPAVVETDAPASSADIEDELFILEALHIARTDLGPCPKVEAAIEFQTEQVRLKIKTNSLMGRYTHH